jgi:hypothetical protein
MMARHRGRDVASSSCLHALRVPGGSVGASHRRRAHGWPRAARTVVASLTRSRHDDSDMVERDHRRRGQDTTVINPFGGRDLTVISWCATYLRSLPNLHGNLLEANL